MIEWTTCIGVIEDFFLFSSERLVSLKSVFSVLNSILCQVGKKILMWTLFGSSKDKKPGNPKKFKGKSIIFPVHVES
jgi:hypothetical protein